VCRLICRRNCSRRFGFGFGEKLSLAFPLRQLLPFLPTECAKPFVEAAWLLLLLLLLLLLPCWRGFGGNERQPATTKLMALRATVRWRDPCTATAIATAV
jgi:hypothetical protein